MIASFVGYHPSRCDDKTDEHNSFLKRFKNGVANPLFYSTVRHFHEPRKKKKLFIEMKPRKFLGTRSVVCFQQSVVDVFIFLSTSARGEHDAVLLKQEYFKLDDGDVTIAYADRIEAGDGEACCPAQVFQI